MVIAMKLIELKIPFGTVHMYRNNSPMSFHAEGVNSGEYILNGLYKLYPDMEYLHKNDVIICEFDDGILQCDGGDEGMTNIIGVYDGYTIGMGTIDSEEFGYSEKILPYKNYGYTDKGFKVYITDNPERYLRNLNYVPLYFIIAWKKGITNDIWTTVSCVTSDMLI